MVDFSPNSRAPYLGDHGVLRVRWGKPHRGSAKKPRSVLTVWPWTAEMIAHWITQGLPRYGDPVNDVFPTSAGTIVTESHLIGRLHGLIDELGFGPGLDLHSFRRSYATHLITGEGFDVTFVQLQLGHEHAATTDPLAAQEQLVHGGNLAMSTMHLWRLQLPTDLAVGAHTAQVTATDAHGRESTETLTFEVTE